jgi:hypothetical protein
LYSIVDTTKPLLLSGYHLLEIMGVAFLQPLQPTVPLATPLGDSDAAHAAFCGIGTVESPQWPLRGWHYHTQHPLELTDVLNGFDSIGEDGVSVAPWSSLVQGVDLFFQWALANKLNYVEWLLLYADEWGDFASSGERQRRLRHLTDLGRNLTLMTSADVPIALRQQHSWYMIKNAEDADWKEQIDNRLAWVLDGAGFDMLGTESGSTEFTHTACSQMLAWINYTAAVCSSKGKPALIKCHCSDAGTCPEFGNNTNFNFLPEFAVTDMGILPHTVQTFGFGDPTSGSYGQQNFTFMRDWMTKVAREQPKRLNVFYGETAYWVNFDINVPLFLPLYADRRISDLRELRRAENNDSNVRFDGQMNFCSGWEWGYWVQEVAVARSSWSVLTEQDGASQDDALRAAFKPIARTFSGVNETAADLILDFLATFIGHQNNLLINGSFSTPNSATPDDDFFGPTFKLNGHAYLEGWEAVADVEFAANTLGLVSTNTQPAHLSLRALMHNDTTECSSLGCGDASVVDPIDFYEAGVRPLLAEMNNTFGSAAAAWVKLKVETVGSAMADPNIGALWDEIGDALLITSLRATQVFAVYEAAAAFRRLRIQYTDLLNTEYKEQLSTARSAIEKAAVLVAAREKNYRAPASRIAAWRSNSFINATSAAPGPTAYTFGYLWTARSLLYWWRDFGIASLASPESRGPCYLNYQNPVDVALGQGSLQDFAQHVRDKNAGKIPASWFTDCLAAPKSEWEFPRDL